MLNELGIPLSLKVWLINNTYDHNSDPNVISATTLLKPIKEIVLNLRGDAVEGELDLVRLIPSSLGTAIHTAIEDAWDTEETLQKNLSLLAIPEAVRKNIIVNPTSEQLTEKCIPVYMENRVHKDIDDYTISGKYDFVMDGVLEDFKTTSVYAWIFQSNAQNYIDQGSIYRWLNPDIITEDYMWIRYLFTDWSKSKAMQDKNYPQARIMSKKYQLKSLEETEAMIRKTIRNIVAGLALQQEDITPCTPEQLWQKDPVFKYYKNPKNRARSTKNFATYHEAHARLAQDGSVGDILHIPGEVVYCKYCTAVGSCDQAREYIETGLLTLD